MIKCIVTALAAVSVIVDNASLTHAQTTPITPAATAAAIAGGVPLHTLAARGNPNVRVERIHLSPADCARVLAGVPAAKRTEAREQQCSMLHYSFHANHLPVPASRASALCCGFWYYSNSDELTDISGGTVWSANEWEDGDANGANVYTWHNQCTPGGLGVAIDDCFTNFNGGGAPYNGLQDAMDICTGLTTQWVNFCFHHGQRRWIDDWGNPSTFYYW